MKTATELRRRINVFSARLPLPSDNAKRPRRRGNSSSKAVSLPPLGGDSLGELLSGNPLLRRERLASLVAVVVHGGWRARS